MRTEVCAASTIVALGVGYVLVRRHFDASARLEAALADAEAAIVRAARAEAEIVALRAMLQVTSTSDPQRLVACDEHARGIVDRHLITAAAATAPIVPLCLSPSSSSISSDEGTEQWGRNEPWTELISRETGEVCSTRTH